MDSTDLEREAAVFDFVERFRADAARDEVKPLAEYLARFRGHEDAIAREYLLLEADLDGRTPPTTASLSHSPLPDDPGLLAAADGQIGPFRVLRELGRGGQGTVFLAEDAELERRVALKVIRTPLRGLPSGRLDRLRREVQIVAHLDHPNICAVYQADVEGEPPWVAMRYVEGETLAQIVHRRRRELGVSHTGSIAASSLTSSKAATGIDVFPTPTDVPAGPGNVTELHRILRVVEGAARALHAAHEAGVIHRDVKPANIMVDGRGEPVLLDFGLARQTDDDLNAITRADDVFGTPAYMSPEQIRSENADIDARTDVYSLGMTLFECLTLRRPFRARSRHELEEKILDEKPPNPSEWNSLVTGDVRTVLDAALTKDRDDRYASALEFAEDLRRLRVYEPIQARAASTWSRLVHWVRRQPKLAAAIGSLVVSLAIGLTVALVLLARVRDERDRSTAQNLAGLALALTGEDPSFALRVAIEAADRGGGYHANNALYAALGACDLERRYPERQIGWTMNDARLSPDGALVGAAHQDGRFAAFDVESGELVHDVELASGEVEVVAFAPDGSFAVCGTASGVAHVVPLRSGGEPTELTGHEGPILGVDVSPDGTLVATASADGRARIFDVESGRTRHELVGHASAVEGVAFSPAGDALLTRGLRHWDEQRRADPVPRIWDVESGELRARLEGHERFVRRACWSPDGNVVATASRDGTARIFDPVDGTCLHVLEHPDKVHGLAFSPDGARLVTTFDPGDVLLGRSSGAHVYRVATGELELELDGHRHRAVSDAAYSPNGERIATCGYDGAVRVWDAVTGALERTMIVGSVRHEDVSWAADGRRILTYDPVGRAFQWILSERPGQLVLRGHDSVVTDGVFLGDGQRCATASVDGTIGIWDGMTGMRTRSLSGHDGVVTALAVDPRGGALASASADGTTRLWSLEDGSSTVLRGHGAAVRGVAYSPDGARLLSWSDDGTARLHHPTTGELVAVLGGHEGPVHTAIFSPDGTLVATGGSDRTARLFDAGDGAPRAVLDVWSDVAPATLFHRVFALEFTAGGTRLLAACEDMHLRSYFTSSGELADSWVYLWTVGALTSIGDGGSVLARAQWGSSLKLLELEPNTDQAVDLWNGSHLARITHTDVSPDGLHVVSSSLDGSVSLWRIDRLEPFAHIRGHEGPVLKVRFSADGRSFLSVSADGTARIWPIDARDLAERRMPIPTSDDLIERLMRGTDVR